MYCCEFWTALWQDCLPSIRKVKKLGSFCTYLYSISLAMYIYVYIYLGIYIYAKIHSTHTPSTFVLLLKCQDVGRLQMELYFSKSNEHGVFQLIACCLPGGFCDDARSTFLSFLFTQWSKDTDHCSFNFSFDYNHHMHLDIHHSINTFGVLFGTSGIEPGYCFNRSWNPYGVLLCDQWPVLVSGALRQPRAGSWCPNW